MSEHAKKVVFFLSQLTDRATWMGLDVFQTNSARTIVIAINFRVKYALTFLIINILIFLIFNYLFMLMVTYLSYVSLARSGSLLVSSNHGLLLPNPFIFALIYISQVVVYI